MRSSSHKLYSILRILGGADRGGKGKSKRAKENGDEEKRLRMVTRANQILSKDSSKNNMRCENAVAYDGF